MRKYLLWLFIITLGLLGGFIIISPTQQGQAQRQVSENDIALAYVRDNTVTLADELGTPLILTGPELRTFQSAKLFWSPDGETLYVATREGLFVTSALGGAATRLPGEYGLTIAIARHGGVLYNLDVAMPQANEDNRTAYPLRETNLSNPTSGRGRLISMIGAYQTGTAEVVLSHAAALYAREAGLLVGGRPRLWPTYGGSLFYTCCFPNPGMNLLEVGAQESFDFDPSFITSAAATNATDSRLAGPTTDGLIRTIDLISAGVRDYTIDIQGGVGAIERIAWSQDDTKLYFVSRLGPANPLELLQGITYPVDTRSAYAVLWELNLVTGLTRELVQIGDVYGVSALVATRNQLFLVIIEPNTALVDALNQGTLPATIAPGDPALDAYMPRQFLWRYDLTTSEFVPIEEGVWGVAARPGH